jgi:hypothetical protein
MKSNIKDKSSVPVAFRSEFNHFQNISATQAWSLFFTASHKDKSLGEDEKVGQFWNILLGVTVFASILAVFIAQS